ncbi:MAG: hypothetical protein A49_21450 [Methyloceanibacter sp.]|nr:MAG: hypothetical protein A49_21450 [Methyloceanibacter sp.]
MVLPWRKADISSVPPLVSGWLDKGIRNARSWVADIFERAGASLDGPTFPWVRLVLRNPVSNKLDTFPDGIHLIAGRAATVSVQERPPTALASTFGSS